MQEVSTMRHPLCLFTLLALAVLSGAAAEEPITYEDHVAGILKKHCAACHGDGKQEGDLNLASFAGLMKGSGGGEIVVAGRSGGSRLVEVITAPDDGDRMPPEGDRVPREAVAMIQKWIDTGLRENAGSSAAAIRTLGFTAAAPAAAEGPGVVPGDLVSFTRAATRRAYPVLALAASPRATVEAADTQVAALEGEAAQLEHALAQWAEIGGKAGLV